MCSHDIEEDSTLTIAFNLFTSSSCATTLLLLPPLFLPDSVLSSPLITLSITLLNSATLFPYAITAPYGSSFVESSLTASLASSNAFVNARLDEGLGCSAGWASFGDNSRRSGTSSWCSLDALPFVAREGEGGTGPDPELEEVRCVVSVGNGTVLLLAATSRDWENAATAARPGDTAGRPMPGENVGGE